MNQNFLKMNNQNQSELKLNNDLIVDKKWEANSNKLVDNIFAHHDESSNSTPIENQYLMNQTNITHEQSKQIAKDKQILYLTEDMSHLSTEEFNGVEGETKPVKTIHSYPTILIKPIHKYNRRKPNVERFILTKIRKHYKKNPCFVRNRSLTDLGKVDRILNRDIEKQNNLDSLLFCENSQVTDITHNALGNLLMEFNNEEFNAPSPNFNSKKYFDKILEARLTDSNSLSSQIVKDSIKKWLMMNEDEELGEERKKKKEKYLSILDNLNE